MPFQYPEDIKNAVNILCEELSKTYPSLLESKFDENGFPSEHGASFQKRMEMSVYIELIKAGVIK